MKTKIYSISMAIALILLALMIMFLGAKSVGASWAPIKIGATQEQQDKINWIWHISQDPAVVMTFERESGLSNAISPYNSNGSRDYSECQLNSDYHWAFITSPGFQDWRVRILYCMEVYSRASSKGKLNTTFYAYPIRHSVQDRFIWFNN